MRGWLLGPLLVLAACGRGEADAPPPTSQPLAITVRVTAQRAGFGCTATNPIEGTGSRLVVSDSSGTRVAVGTFELSEGAESCDWTTKVTIPEPGGLLTLTGSGGELATVAPDDYSDGQVTLVGNISGKVTVKP
jgi:hypothetical protein